MCVDFLFHSDSDLVLVVVCLYGWGVGHLFLQLLAFTICDCLSSGLLLGDLLCVSLLTSLLGSLFMHLLSEGAVLMYNFVPGVRHLAIARVFLIKWAVVSC